MKSLLRILLLLCCLSSSAQQTLRFKASKPYSVFNFLTTISDPNRAASPALVQQIDAILGTDPILEELKKEYQQLDLYMAVALENLPEGRKQQISTYDLLMMALAQSNHWQEFVDRSMGIIPNRQQVALVALLKKAEKTYDRLFTPKEWAKLENWFVEMRRFEQPATEMFLKMRQFYGSIWPEAYPFTVVLYPISGSNGGTSATPHINSLCVGVLLDSKDYAGQMGVVLHEMAHVLYDQQPVDLQFAIQSYFEEFSNNHSHLAYHYFDEALATALGNGWAFERLTGKLEADDWYTNEYINGFGKALFPMVKNYIEKGRTLDREFVREAIRLFAQRFPKAHLDFQAGLMRSDIYMSTENRGRITQVMDLLYQRFHLSTSRISAPIRDERSAEMLTAKDPITQFVFVLDEIDSNWEFLQKHYVQLRTLSPQNGLYGLVDAQGRNVFILVARESDQLTAILDAMVKRNYFEPSTVVQFTL